MAQSRDTHCLPRGTRIRSSSEHRHANDEGRFVHEMDVVE